jgi:hypothetical protein
VPRLGPYAVRSAVFSDEPDARRPLVVLLLEAAQVNDQRRVDLASSHQRIELGRKRVGKATEVGEADVATDEAVEPLIQWFATDRSLADIPDDRVTVRPTEHLWSLRLSAKDEFAVFQGRRDIPVGREQHALGD